jgi:hypothetical protein
MTSSKPQTRGGTGQGKSMSEKKERRLMLRCDESLGPCFCGRHSYDGNWIPEPTEEDEEAYCACGKPEFVRYLKRLGYCRNCWLRLTARGRELKAEWEKEP